MKTTVVADSRRTSAVRSALVLCCLLWSLLSEAQEAQEAQESQPPPFLSEGAASFEGQLPCADCPGVLWKLDLWPEGRFHLRQEYLDRDSVAVSLGKWRYEPEAQRLALIAPEQEITFLTVVSEKVLELLDRRGEAIESTLNYALQRQAVFAPGEFPVSLAGTFRYFADAASFTDCGTGFSYAVAMAGNYLDLERAYLTALSELAPGAVGGAPWLIQLDGHLRSKPAMEGEGTMQALVVESFHPLVGAACPDKGSPMPPESPVGTRG